MSCERSVLSCILQTPALVSQAREQLDASHFKFPIHKRIFGAILSLDEQGITPNEGTVAIHLMRMSNGNGQSSERINISDLVHDAPRTDDLRDIARMLRVLANDDAIKSEFQLAQLKIEDGESGRDVLEVHLPRLTQLSDSPSDSKRFFIPAVDLHSLPAAQLMPSTPFVRFGLNVVYGPSGVCKTFLVIDHALVIAQSEAVIYWAGEGASGFNARCEAWCGHYQMDPGNLHFCFELLNLLDTHSVGRFLNHAYQLAPVGLLVVDTWARALVGGEENSAKDTGLAISNLSRLQTKLKTTIVVVHHSNKAERGERGSGALRGAADLMLEMTNDDGLVSVVCSKAKDYSPFDTQHYRLVSHGDSAVLLPDEQVAPDDSKLTPQQIKVLEVLALEIFDLGATITQIQAAGKLPESSLFRVLSTLKRKGLILQTAKGRPYTISEAGRNKLSNSQDTLNETLRESTHSTTLTLTTLRGES